MKVRSITLGSRYVGLGALAAALLAGPALVASPATALPATPPGTICLTGDPGPLPGPRRVADTPAVSAATLERVARETAAAGFGSAARMSIDGGRAAALPTYRVHVRIHIIHGTHKKERKLKRRGARTKVFQVLRNAYNGAQSTSSEPMGVNFELKKITITKNDRWYHALPWSRAAKQMKRTLHRGKASTLNIYLNSPPKIEGQALLGYSTFPWRYRGHRKMDGVIVNVASLPGGSARGYNLGDTIVHETGHWLGLLHTFQGGCANQDWVGDTPAEAAPSFRCEVGRDSCRTFDPITGLPVDDGLLDPIHNFMDYSYDSCMFEFTPGQHTRVAQQYATYRFGR